MDQLVDAIQKINARFEIIHSIVNNASDGLDPRIDSVQEGSIDNAEKIESLEQENKQLRFELDLIKNIVFKQDTDITSVRSRITDLTARSMSKNITISGILDDPGNAKENCKQTVIGENGIGI